MKQETWILLLIGGGVLAWGAFHALGAYFYNHDPRRGLMVMGCVAAFLTFWWLMYQARSRRMAREGRRPR